MTDLDKNNWFLIPSINFSIFFKYFCTTLNKTLLFVNLQINCFPNLMYSNVVFKRGVILRVAVIKMFRGKRFILLSLNRASASWAVVLWSLLIDLWPTESLRNTCMICIKKRQAIVCSCRIIHPMRYTVSAIFILLYISLPEQYSRHVGARINIQKSKHKMKHISQRQSSFRKKHSTICGSGCLAEASNTYLWESQGRVLYEIWKRRLVSDCCGGVRAGC